MDTNIAMHLFSYASYNGSKLITTESEQEAQAVRNSLYEARKLLVLTNPTYHDWLFNIRMSIIKERLELTPISDNYLVYQIFTFMGKQVCLANCYNKVWGKTPGHCRERMVEYYGKRWGFQYVNEVAAGVKQFNLKLNEEIQKED